MYLMKIDLNICAFEVVNWSLTVGNKLVINWLFLFWNGAVRNDFISRFITTLKKALRCKRRIVIISRNLSRDQMQ